MTDWKPGDPIYPRPVPWTQGDPATAGHRDNGRCWCDQPVMGRPPHWTARYDRDHPPPRFRTQDEVRRDRTRYLPQLLEEDA